ncbi:MAG: V-type ATP synthase subunit I [Clostridiales bacterium]|nr:V-type ATP synthase subunit I [Clostridiales bacterium]
MSIVRMKRLRLIVMAEERDELFSRLLHVGCVEMSEPDELLSDPDWAALLSRATSSLGDVKAGLASVTSALATLKKYAPVKTGLFVKRTPISEADFFDGERAKASLANAQEINECVSTIAQLTTQQERLSAQRASLTPWETLDLPLEQEGTQTTALLMGTIPTATDLDEVRGELAQCAPLTELMPISEDKEFHYVLLLCHKAEWPSAQEVLKPYTFSSIRFKEFTGTARENIQALTAELDRIEGEKEAAKARIVALGPCRSDLQLLQDRLNQDAAKEAAEENGLTDGQIVYLEGWVEAPKQDKLERELKRFDLAYELTDPEEGEMPPSKLDNPDWMKPINMVTEMYSAPAYDGIDPNPVVFFWYVFFFGFMFADVGYGIVIFLVSFLITRTFHPKGGMGNAFGLGQWLGLSTFLCGIFTGGFFGNSVEVFSESFLGIASENLPAWLQAFNNGIIVNPINDPMTLLILSIVLGAVQLVCGQCIHIYMEARDGHPMEGILDVVPWWILFAGIGVIALTGSAVGLIIGVVALVATQGRHNKGIFSKIFGGVSSLYDITSWLSDLLSYARLMALMLATSVIAMVFNTLAALPGNIIAFVLIFLIGHVFNIGVNLVGTYVHAARLQYLEYYGKFYKDGGTFFKPLHYNTKFVDIIEEET